MKALVVNCSPGHYNLGAAKLADWLRSQAWDVEAVEGDPGMFALGYDLVALSVIFSWHALTAREIALRVKDSCEVWCGGPGVFALARWFRDETGLDVHRGLDWRFERQRGDYEMTFASRGCPQGCWWCIVPKAEGLAFSLDWDFVPARILCDNNLSQLPVDFQEHIIRRYEESGVPLRDANSGFEPANLDEATFRRWEPLLSRTRAPWRFAFDEERERVEVLRVLRMLGDLPPYRKRVYCLVGHEPIEQCYDRAKTIVAEGGEPFVQHIRQLNYLGGPWKMRHDWTEKMAIDFQRYWNRYVWRSAPIWEYRHRKYEPPPFAFLKPGGEAREADEEVA